MFKIIFNKTLILQIISQLAFGIIGALLVQAILIKKPNSIATVNMIALQDSFVHETARESLSQEEKQQRVALFSQLLMQSINQIAKEKQAAVLLSEAVIAGNQDYTEEVANLIKKGMKT
jgi:flagellar hook-basal body complex protein FliE